MLYPYNRMHATRSSLKNEQHALTCQYMTESTRGTHSLVKLYINSYMDDIITTIN